MIQNLIAQYQQKHSNQRCISLNADELQVRELINSQDLAQYKRNFDAFDIIFIDEGQRSQHIGMALKIMKDHYQGSKQIIVTGSSSFHLLSGVGESLMGRKRVFHLHPLSVKELVKEESFFAFHQKIQQHLIWGMYPAVVVATSDAEKRRRLQELASSSLFRDILEFERVKNASLLHNLLKAIALRVGSEISYDSLANLLGIKSRTVERYVNLLEQSYIIYRLPPYFTNKEKEIAKMHKIYFMDVGIRNALLDNFAPLSGRNDSGALWENWVINEFRKLHEYHNIPGRFYFWRGRNQQEVDLLHENDGILEAYEMKSFSSKKPKIPSLFSRLYPQVAVQRLDFQNYAEVLLGS